MHSPQSSEVDLGSRVMIRRGGSEPRGLLGEAQGQDCRPAPMARSLVLQPEKENKGRLRRNCQWHKFASKHSYTPSSLLRSPWTGLLSLAKLPSAAHTSLPEEKREGLAERHPHTSSLLASHIAGSL